VPFLLAERAYSESARAMHAVKGNLSHSFREKCRELWRKYLRELVGHEA
jgi:hypothetical protein